MFDLGGGLAGVQFRVAQQKIAEGKVGVFAERFVPRGEVRAGGRAGEAADLLAVKADIAEGPGRGAETIGNLIGGKVGPGAGVRWDRNMLATENLEECCLAGERGAYDAPMALRFRDLGRYFEIQVVEERRVRLGGGRVWVVTVESPIGDPKNRRKRWPGGRTHGYGG